MVLPVRVPPSLLQVAGLRLAHLQQPDGHLFTVISGVGAHWFRHPSSGF